MLLEKEIGLMVFNLGKQLNLEKAHLEKIETYLRAVHYPLVSIFLSSTPKRKTSIFLNKGVKKLSRNPITPPIYVVV